MWIKASDNSTGAFFHNAAPELEFNKHSLSRNKEENGKENLLSQVWKINTIKIIISEGDVMWIKASENPTEAFLHNIMP